MSALLKKTGFISLMSLAATFAHPMLANEIASAPPSACFLKYRNTSSQEVQCSGVLVSKSMLVTAAHCFPESSSKISSTISIQCGLKSQSATGEDFSFTEEFTGQGVRLASNGAGESGVDFAFVHLSKPAGKVSPMALPKSLASFREDFMVPSPLSAGDLQFKQSIECRSSGFGTDPAKKKAYFKTSDQSPANGLRGYASVAEDRASNLVIRSWGEGISTFRHGDSGGAFYCRQNMSSEWQLIGIISSGLVRGSGESTGVSFFASTASNEFLGFYRQMAEEWR